MGDDLVQSQPTASIQPTDAFDKNERANCPFNVDDCWANCYDNYLQYYNQYGWGKNYSLPCGIIVGRKPLNDLI